jgi:hypothetical protein
VLRPVVGARLLLFTELPSETVRKGARDGTGASILVVSNSEIELLGPVSAVCEASCLASEDFSDSL